MYSFYNRIKSLFPAYERFFEGKWYPCVIAALVLLGHNFEIELYLFPIVALLSTISLLICRGVKGHMITFVCFIYQIPKAHTPAFPTFSDYYFQGGRGAVVIIFASLLFAALIYRFIRLASAGFRPDTPMLIPTLVLCGAFLFNGAFSDRWSAADVAIGAAEALVFFLVFYFFYLGLEKYSSREIVDHFCFISLILGVLLALQVLDMLAFEGVINGGSIVKDNVTLGWGIWNPVGFCLTVLIPMQLYGAMREGSKPLPYLFGAAVCAVCAALTLSRNALLFSALSVGVMLIAGCFLGARKKLFRITSVSLVGIGLAGAMLLWNKISSLLSDVLERGFSDNGRYELWWQGIKNFLSSPIFGKGFFGYGQTDVFEVAAFIPTMAHSTPVQLLSAMGIVGFLAYAYYRVKSLTPFIKKPTLEKCALLAPVLVTLGMSLLDNFIFYLYTAFYSLIALAIAFRVWQSDEQRAN